MKNLFKVFGIIAMVAMIGFAFIACDDGSKEEKKTETDAAVTGVTVSSSELTLVESEEKSLSFSVQPGNAKNKKVTWSSSAPSVASVDAEGKVKAIAKGSAVITVTTEEGSFKSTCSVTVLQAPASIAITTAATKTIYYKGEAIDLTGLVVTATFSDSTTAVIDNKLLHISGFNSHPVNSGEQTVTITYGGKSATFNVTVFNYSITGIEVTQMPNKVEYAPGAAFDITGLEVSVVHSDETTTALSPGSYTLSGFSSVTEGDKTITVTWNGRTTTFDVLVINPDRVLQSLTITSNPTKMIYYQGDEIDLTGMIVKGDYGDGFIITIGNTLLDITPDVFNTTGTVQVWVEYKNKSTSFNVTVNALVLQSIAVISRPTKKDYYLGEAFEFAGIEITATFNSGTRQLSDNDPRLEITSFSNNSYLDIGANKQVTIKYTNPQNASNSVTTTTPVNVSARAEDYEDFGATPVVQRAFNVANTTEWTNAINTITSGANNLNYIINITADFNIAGVSSATFGIRTGIKVSIRGAGRTLSLSSNGNILRISSNQTVIMRDVTMQGRASNNASLINNSGTFNMYGGTITGNTTSYDGSGVYINSGTFNMYGGTITGNTTSNIGGGVYISSGTFNMYGGTISGNTSSSSGGVYTIGTINMYGGTISGNTSSSTGGGGVFVVGTMRISNGTIYGNDATVTANRNTATTGAAVNVVSGSTARNGTFDAAGNFTQLGTITTRANGFKVTDGVLTNQQ